MIISKTGRKIGRAIAWVAYVLYKKQKLAIGSIAIDDQNEWYEWSNEPNDFIPNIPAKYREYEKIGRSHTKEDAIQALLFLNKMPAETKVILKASMKESKPVSSFRKTKKLIGIDIKTWRRIYE